MKARYHQLIRDSKERKGCKCPELPGKLLPEPPCDVHRRKPQDAAERELQRDNTRDAWDLYRRRYKNQKKMPVTEAELKASIVAKLREVGITR